MPLSTYCIRFDHPESRDHAVLFSTRTAAAVILTRDALQDLERDTLSSDERDSLAALGFLVSNLEDEKREMLVYIDQMNVASTAVRPTVVMNLDCNLACSYCFEGTRKGKHFLSEETANDLVGFLERNLAGRKEISPIFYGGEPLLSGGMIERLSGSLRDLGDAAGANYEFTMITNGTLLTRRVAEQLKPLGLRSVSVTLDGPRDVHDSSRPFRSGAGSFDTIVRNVQDVSDLIEVQVGGNYMQENYRDFPRLLDFLLESELGPDRISSVEFSPVLREAPEFVPDFHGGCANVNETWISEAGIFLRQEIIARGYRTPAMDPAVCMVERNERVVVNWNGELYKCPNLIDRKEYCIGMLRSGMRDHRGSHDLGNWKNDECLGCCYLPFCFGGCRYMKLLAEGCMQGVDCKREYFDRTLHTLVLQDVKQAGSGRT